MSSSQCTQVAASAIKPITETELIPERTSDYVIFGSQFFLSQQRRVNLDF